MEHTEPDTLPLPYADADVPTLISIWRDALQQLLAAAEAAGPAGWDAPSPCPGWTVGDLVAHVTSIERFLLGRTDPVHEPNYEDLPHAEQGLSKVIEIPVDLRRSWSRDDVLAEARQTLDDRHRSLIAGPQEPDAELLGPFGKPMPVPAVLRMRIFDIWIHEQDIRVALGTPGDLGTPAAWVAAATIESSLGYVWVRKAAAPDGAVAEIRVEGPGVSFARQVANRDGRGVTIEPLADPTVVVRVSWPDLVALAAGRVPADSGPELAQVTGDLTLGEALVTRLAVTP